MKGKRTVWVWILVILASVVFAAQDPAALVGSHLPSQAAADQIRSATGSDAALLAAGLIKDTFESDNLATLLQYPSDEIVVMKLTGAQIRQALERSVSLYPQPNSSFLQLSGISATFSKSAAAGQRITVAKINDEALDDARTYSVAMPSSLSRGGLGYFKIWDRTNVIRTLPDLTVEKVLKDVKYDASKQRPRWSEAS